MAKASYWQIIDAEVRRCGEQTGLDTLVVRTVNDECWFLAIYCQDTLVVRTVNDECWFLAIYCQELRETIKHSTWGVRRQR